MACRGPAPAWCPDRMARRLAASRAKSLGPDSRCVGIAAQQSHADRAQIGRNVGRQLAREAADRSCSCRQSTSASAPGERKRPGQRFVEGDADAVPVAGFGWRRTRRLPRAPCTRVCRRSRSWRSPACSGSELGDQAEVEDDDAPFGGHQHVGRLDVAMKLASPMQCGDAVDELPERGDQSVVGIGAARSAPRT